MNADDLISQLEQYKEKENWYEIVEVCNNIIKKHPNLAEAYNERGLAYVYRALFQEAIKDFTKAIKLNPDFAEAYANRGVAFSVNDIHHLAIEDLSQALKIKPDFEEARKNLEMAKKRF